MASKVTAPSHTTLTVETVDGDMEIGKHVIVRGTGSPPTVRVNGTVYCEGHDTFECALSAKELNAEDSVTVQGDLNVDGDVEVEDGRLTVYGNMTAKSADVGNAVYVTKDLSVDEIEVGGSLKVEGKARIDNVEVGGSFEAKGEVTADKIEVGGSLSADAKVDAKSIDVGGTVRIGGGRILHIDVGGTFSREPPSNLKTSTLEERFHSQGKAGAVKSKSAGFSKFKVTSNSKELKQVGK